MKNLNLKSGLYRACFSNCMFLLSTCGVNRTFDSCPTYLLTGTPNECSNVGHLDSGHVAAARCRQTGFWVQCRIAKPEPYDGISYLHQILKVRVFITNCHKGTLKATSMYALKNKAAPYESASWVELSTKENKT